MFTYLYCLFSQEKEERWRTVFLITACFYFFGNFIFVLFGQAKIQPWNEPKDTNINKK